MNRIAKGWQCGISVGLALLFCGNVQAETLMPESNYVLIEDQQDPQRSRLLVMNDATDGVAAPAQTDAQILNDEQRGIAMAASVDSRDRVRALTLLAGSESFAALETAFVLMTDQDSRVREEALQVLFEHPQVDRQFVIQLGREDTSLRVRQATAELLAEASGD